MRKRNVRLNAIHRTLGVLLLISVAVAAGAAERTLVIGAEGGWNPIVSAQRILQRPGRGGYTDVTIEPYRFDPTPTTEFLLRFDSLPIVDATGNYAVGSPAGAESQELTRTAQRAGSGALLLDGPEDRLVVRPKGQSAFSPGTEWSSFSIEFWFYPVVLTDGDSILSWRARGGADDGFREQSIEIGVDRGVIRAQFTNFFVKPDGSGTMFELHGTGRLIPRAWSHNIIRFDGTTGLLEYVVDGSPVDVTYASNSGHEDGSVFYPRIAPVAPDGIVIGDGPIGALDDLRIERSFVDDDPLPAYAPEGASIVTDYFDLGSTGARLTGISAVYDKPGLTDVFLSYRLVDLRDRTASADGDWTPVSLTDPRVDATGRYLQLRADLYPDTRSGITPTLSEITVTYEEDPPPLPPTHLRAVPGDGSVTLSFVPGQEPDIRGYLVYYGDRSGRYFGTGSDLGASPIDIGNADSVTVTGLANGTLYFFAVEAYDASGGSDSSQLSTEVAARPARVYR